jgi:membrane protein
LIQCTRSNCEVRDRPNRQRAIRLLEHVVGNRDADAARHHCSGEEEKRGFLSFNLLALALSAGFALFGIAALALVAVLPAALTLVPVSSARVDVLGLVRWPIMAGIVILALAIVYRYAPDRAQPRWRWISWGAAGATVPMALST